MKAITRGALFRGARLKVKRAQHHIGDAHQLVKAFISLNPYKIIVEKHPDGSQELTLTVTQSLDKNLPLIIGDAIHNLASALDHLTWEMVRLDNITPSCHLQFPRAPNAKEYINTVHGKIKGVRRETMRLFEEIQVYPGGHGGSLYELIQADITDKHTVMLPVVSAALLSPFRVTREDGTKTLGSGRHMCKFDADGRIRLVSTEDPGSQFQFENEPNATLFVVLENSGLRSSLQIRHMFDRFAEATKGTLERFANYVMQRTP